MFNSENEQIGSKVIRIENTNFVFLGITEFDNGYYLMINGEKIVLYD